MLPRGDCEEADDDDKKRMRTMQGTSTLVALPFHRGDEFIALVVEDSGVAV